MTNQDYVTFPTAKLLKEAGYPQETSLRSYRADGKMTCTDNGIGCCDAPHLYDVMKWLREEKSIDIEIQCACRTQYVVEVWAITERFNDRSIPINTDIRCVPTYEQACDAGIAAACKWLLGENHSKEA